MEALLHKTELRRATQPPPTKAHPLAFTHAFIEQMKDVTSMDKDVLLGYTVCTPAKLYMHLPMHSLNVLYICFIRVNTQCAQNS